MFTFLSLSSPHLGYLYDNNKSAKTFKEHMTIFPQEINPAFYTYYDFYINKTEENKEMTRKYEM